MKLSDHHEIGPVEVEEPGGLIWNCVDWPCYIRCTMDSAPAQLALLMRRCWRLKQPQLMLSMLSDANPLTHLQAHHITQISQTLVQTASSLNTWFITDGLDCGIASLLGRTLSSERLWQESLSINGHLDEPLASCMLLGAVDVSKLSGDPLLQRHMQDLKALDEYKMHLKKKGQRLWGQSETQSREFKNRKNCIDEHHSHFLFVSAAHEQKPVDAHLLALDTLEELRNESAWNSADKSTLKIAQVALLVQGNVFTAQTCAQYLSRSISLIVIQGSGGLADLLAYAHTQLNERFPTGSPTIETHNTYIRNVLGPCVEARVRCSTHLSQTVCAHYTRCILHCASLAIRKAKLVVITCEQISSLQEYMLKVHLASSDSVLSVAEQRKKLVRDLRLAMACNCVSVAQRLLKNAQQVSELVISERLLLHALITCDRPNGAHLLRLLLSERGPLRARHVLRVDALCWLLKGLARAPAYALLCTSGWIDPSSHTRSTQNLLNKTYNVKSKINENLEDMLIHMNKLIERATSIRNLLSHNDFINAHNHSYVCLEQKALLLLCVWAAVSQKDRLVHAFWPLSTYPLHLLLFTSRTLQQLAFVARDFALKEKYEKQAKVFAILAERLLHECSKQSEIVSTRLLGLQMDHFDSLSPIDIAVDMHNYSFVAHESSQKWLQRKLMGSLHVCGAQYGEFITAIKLLLSVLLVFPVGFWFEVKSDLTNLNDLSQNSWHNTRSLIPLLMQDKKQELCIWPLWWRLVHTPIAKYWLAQSAYILFLSIFTLSVVMPDCAWPLLDLTVCIWAMCLHLDEAVVRARRHKRYLSQRNMFSWLELPFVLSFVLLYSAHRYEKWSYLQPYAYSVRMFALCTLIYHYLKFMYTFMPVSSKIGPLIYFIKLMSLHDMLSFITLCWPFFVSFGVIIEVALYPDSQLSNGYHLYSIFYRSMVSIFRSPFRESRTPNDDCENKWNQPFINNTICQTSSYWDVNCNNRGLFSNIFFLTFFLLVKVLTTVLGALFSESMWTLDRLTLWRFQQFHLITKFELHDLLPPPFSIITHFIKIIFLIFLKIISFFRTKQQPNLQNLKKSNCLHCENESLQYFWQCVSKSTLEIMEQEK